MPSRVPRNPSRIAFVPVAALSVLGVLMFGCEGESEEVTLAPKRVAPAPPPVPPKPSVTPVATLMAQLSIDERILMTEEDAPGNDADRRAVLTYFDAFARGDSDTLGRMMSGMDRRELEALVDSGVWAKTIEGITEIEIQTGRSPLDDACALAVFTDVDDDGEFRFQPQLWYYTTDSARTQFDAVATPPHILDLLYGDDWIRVWHQLLQEEVLLANKLDVELDKDPVYIGGESSGGSNVPGSAPSTPSRSPGFAPPGGAPDRRPPGKKRKPPGAR